MNAIAIEKAAFSCIHRNARHLYYGSSVTEAMVFVYKPDFLFVSA